MLRRDCSYGALLATLVGTIFLFQVLGIVSLGIGGAEQSLAAAMDLRVTMQTGANDQNIATFLTALKRQPFAASAVLITREQAYEEQRSRDPSLISLVERAGLGNPFRDTIALRLTEGATMLSVEEFLRKTEWAGTIDPASLTLLTEQDERATELVAGARTIRMLSMFLAFLALAATVFALIMSFDARAIQRSEEITVARLLGATPRNVLIPFATEATVLIILASVLSILALAAVLSLLPVFFPVLLAGGSLTAAWDQIMAALLRFLPLALVLHILLAPCIGWLGVKMGIKMAPLSL